MIGDDFFILIKFMAGGDLHHYLKERESYLVEDEIKFMCFQLTQAVHALHEQSIVHRDIKVSSAEKVAKNLQVV